MERLRWHKLTRAFVPSRGLRFLNKVTQKDYKAEIGFRPLAGSKVSEPKEVLDYDGSLERFPSPCGD